jgi:hypothetical protein
MPADSQAVERAVDEALCHLPEKDRTAVVLRYLQGKSQREVADAMGVSEGAAAQRLSRAVAKLRKLFSSRGMMLATVVATEQALQRACAAAPTPPSGLAATAAEAALSPAAASTVVAHAIADSVRATLRRKTVAMLTTALLGLVLLLAAIGGAALHITRSGATRGAMAHTPSVDAAATAEVVKSPIHVGVYVSAATAIPRPARDNAWYHMFVIADDLKGETDMDVVPIIEPGTTEQPQQKRLMGVYFPGKTPVDVMNTAAVRRLDVIVASFVHTPPQRALESIDAAVHDGTGLFVRRCLGNHPPQNMTPQAIRLRGLATQAPESTMRGKPNEWVIVSGHPILGSLTPTSLKQPIVRRATGVWGTLPPDAVPLIRLRHVESLIPTGNGPTTRPALTANDTTGDIVYLSHWGKGRIVSANFNLPETPAEIQQATDNRFTALSVKWLASRPVE